MARGMPPRVALTTLRRKLFVLANALVHTESQFNGAFRLPVPDRPAQRCQRWAGLAGRTGASAERSPVTVIPSRTHPVARVFVVLFLLVENDEETYGAGNKQTPQHRLLTG